MFHTMNKTSFSIVTIILISMFSGCTGESDDQVGMMESQDQSSEPDWINDRGVGVWSLSLNDSQWLEVKNAHVLYTAESGANSSNPATVQASGGWRIYASGHSPIFGGDYQICTYTYQNSRECYGNSPENPNDPFSQREYSIIYRIHEI